MAAIRATTNHLLGSALSAIASGTSLDEALLAIADAVVARFGPCGCKIWLVKHGDICDTCAMAKSCQDRSLCLHLKAERPEIEGESPRVPLSVFRDRIAARGGAIRLGDRAGAGHLLFGQPAIGRLSGDVLAALPLNGPAGVVGLLAVLRSAPLTREDLADLRELADAAIAAIRIADLTSRHQRAAHELEEATEMRAEVEGLLHALLYGSSEYDVVAEDLAGNVTVFSEGARTMYGYAPEEVIGRVKADVLFAPEEVESGRVVEILNEAMTMGRSEAVVMRLRKNGERFPVRATFTVRRDADGDPAGFVVVERDLSVERNSAQLTETAAQRIAELQDHLHTLKSSNASLEKEAVDLRRENAENRERIARLTEVDELNTIRIELIKDLRRRLVAITAERDHLKSRVPNTEG